jgi:serine phosphatase RsbU (regulator of sigma subunit)
MHAVAGKPVDTPHILVVEDDPLVRFNIVSYLEDSGFSVAEEASGAAGLETIRTQPPDLVLCDLRMPGLDGLDVLEILHAEQPELPVIVVSGTGVLSDAVNALRNGAWDFVTKPIADMAVLEHAIVGALDKARLIHDNRRIQSELEHANRLLRQNLEQFEQDAAAGRKMQLQLMPPGQRTLSGYRFNRYLLPSLYLSGDFLDYFVIDHRHVGFYLADVSGHGASSAFITILLNSFVHRYLDLLQNEGEQAILSPAQMLARLNTHMLDQKLEKYLTMFYGVIDVDSNRLSYSNGGHFPNPVLFDGSTTGYLDGRGPPVGLFADARFDRFSIALPDTHVLAICSDGVLDALPGESLDEKRARLQRAVSRPGLSAREALAALGLTADEEYPDDITLLLVERSH